MDGDREQLGVRDTASSRHRAVVSCALVVVFFFGVLFLSYQGFVFLSGRLQFGVDCAEAFQHLLLMYVRA